MTMPDGSPVPSERESAEFVLTWMRTHGAVTLQVDDENRCPSYARLWVDASGITHDVDDQELDHAVAWLPASVISNPTAPAWNPAVTLTDIAAWLKGQDK